MMKAQMVLNIILGNLTLLVVKTTPTQNILGAIMIAYFLSMLYYNVIRKYHDGSWAGYFNAIFTRIKTTIQHLMKTKKITATIILAILIAFVIGAALHAVFY